MSTNASPIAESRDGNVFPPYRPVDSLIPILTFLTVIASFVFLYAIMDMQRRVDELSVAVNANSIEVTEINAEELLAEVEHLKDQLDTGVSSFNSLIDWTQFVGIAIAVVAGVAALVGLRDSRKDHAALQERLAEADEKLKRIDDTIADVAQLRKASSAAQIGQRQLAMENLREAVRVLEVALSYSQEKDETLIYLWADASLRLNGARGASEAFDRLEKLEPDKVEFPSASALYAYAARLLGDRAENEGAEEEAARFYKISESVYRSVRRKNEYLLDSFGESVFGGLAGLYRRQGKNDAKKRKVALATYEFCRTITPNSSYVLNNLALLQYREDANAAKETFQKCLKLAEKKRGDMQNDYWAIFDAVTAHIALGDAADSLKADLEEAILLVRSRAQDDEPIRKFLSGLEELACTPEPAALKEIMKIVREKLKAGPAR